ncbi:MAG: hypothetical protein M3R57_07375, partial [Chloroflexota bacterium]|nr:hypothetical protein [Chloroflexota bacterium]
MLLVGPGGEQATIFSDAGGTTDVGVPINITLDDAAGGGIPTPLVGGTFKPTNAGTELDAFPLPAPQVTGFPTGPAPLSVVNTTAPNGTWSLYVIDDGASGAIGNISGGWSLNITTTGSAATPFSNSTAIGGVDRPASPLRSSPYPSAISVAGFSGTASGVTVTLNGFRHTFPDDVDLLLEGPGGQNALIMSDVGGSTDVQNLTIVLDDAAATSLPDTTILGNGTFKPTNGAGADTFPAPAPAPGGGSVLSVFNGLSPNGTWNLWGVDDLGIDSGYLTGGWSLNISGPTAVGVSSLSATPVKR